MKKMLLSVCCLVLLASFAYGQETMDEFVERGMREYRQREFEREQLDIAREREEREETMARSQYRVNMLIEELLSRPQQYQIRRNGDMLIIDEY